MGSQAPFPKRLRAGREEETAWVLGDSCIDKRRRSLGPALQLLRAPREDIEAGAVGVGYDSPSATMMAVYRRLKVEPTLKMTRFAKPLKVDRKVDRIVRGRFARSPLSRNGNMILAMPDRAVKEAPGIGISINTGDFNDEFSALAAVRGNYGISVRRATSILNWRYVHNPLHR